MENFIFCAVFISLDYYKLYYKMEQSSYDLLFRNHCLKNVRIWSYSGLYFPAFGLNTERYGVVLLIRSKCGKIRTRITLNRDTFHSVNIYKTDRIAIK